MLNRAGYNLIAAGVLLCLLAFGLEWGVRKVRMATMPHHWYAMEYFYHRKGKGAAASDLERAIGPFPSKEACIREARSGICMDVVDADVNPEHGIEAP